MVGLEARRLYPGWRGMGDCTCICICVGPLACVVDISHPGPGERRKSGDTAGCPSLPWRMGGEKPANHTLGQTSCPSHPQLTVECSPLEEYCDVLWLSCP